MISWERQKPVPSSTSTKLLYETVLTQSPKENLKTLNPKYVGKKKKIDKQRVGGT